MEEAFIAFCFRRNFFFRQQRSDFRTDQSGILHDVLCCAGMNAAAFDMNDCLCGIEVFVFQFADFAAVQCVGKVSTKFFHIKMICPSANFFIWCKGNTDFAVGDFGMGD